MKPGLRTRWNLSPRAAMRLQERLRDRVIDEDHHGEIRSVAGADLAFDGDTAFAGVVVFRFPGLEEVERCFVRHPLRFPYIPGLLSFRECPALLAAFRRLRTEPDLVMIDGHGQAHPRLFGIACHMGVLLDKPTIGCAKSRLVGEYKEPGARAGRATPLMFQGRRVGVVLRTRDNARPIYVTVGHRVSLDSAVKLVRGCMDGFRIPKPTREADRYVRGLRMAHKAQKAVVQRRG